jgi:hypothetical protein
MRCRRSAATVSMRPTGSGVGAWSTTALVWNWSIRRGYRFDDRQLTGLFLFGDEDRRSTWHGSAAISREARGRGALPRPRRRYPCRLPEESILSLSVVSSSDDLRGCSGRDIRTVFSRKHTAPPPVCRLERGRTFARRRPPSPVYEKSTPTSCLLTDRCP